jgi:DNA-binding CsgD family transcriptional regulator
MLVDGHSIGSAAAQLGIKEQVAKNHLRHARHRAGGMNTYALVAKVAVEIYKAQWAKMRMG